MFSILLYKGNFSFPQNSQSNLSSVIFLSDIAFKAQLLTIPVNMFQYDREIYE